VYVLHVMCVIVHMYIYIYMNVCMYVLFVACSVCDCAYVYIYMNVCMYVLFKCIYI